MAAMCSADYDGDQGRMGKQAFKTTGLSPEADHLREKFAEIVAWRNANVPKCEVWITEFGYDTNPQSPIHAPAIGPYTAHEVQGMWLLRSVFALAAAGVDRAAMFMFRDTKTDGPGVFETCGLVTEKGQWTPKPSYFYLATLKKRLAGMRFVGDVPSGKPDVSVYRFTGAGGKTAYAVWCPTSDDHTVPDVSLAISGKTATRIEFTNDTLDGKATPLRIQNGQVRVTAIEKPILILME